jgi:hypothetical protein
MSSNSVVTPTVSTGFDVNAHFQSVMSDLGLSPEDTGGRAIGDQRPRFSTRAGGREGVAQRGDAANRPK